MKSGALQGAIVIDYPFDHRFESIHIVYDGTNGQLPNLDLLNTVTSIASGQMGIGVSLQQMWHHSDSYKDRLQTMLRGMMKQGLGHASGPHSSFIPYHVDAVTIQPFGEGWQDEMAMGRIIESTFRSLNNLLEHLHQSFFFYLLMQSNRFVSIGTYLPSAMLVAVSFTIMAIHLWLMSGSPRAAESKPASTESGEKSEKLVLIQEGDAKALVPEEALSVRERELFLPLAVVAGSQFLGVLPLYIFNHTTQAVRISSTLPLPQLTASDVNPSFHCLRGHQLCPTIYHLKNINALLRPHSPTIPPHEILLPPAPRPLPLLPRNTQLLARFPNRSPRRPTNLYPPTLALHPRPPIKVVHRNSVPSNLTDRHSADYGSGRGMLGLGIDDQGCTYAGGVRVGCLGHEYSGCGLVRVVAGVACWGDFVVWKAKG